MTWTQENGDTYRTRYAKMSFSDIRGTMDRLNTEYYQVTTFPAAMLEFIYFHRSKADVMRVLELGGYDGSHALQLLTFFPKLTWINQDISPVAQRMTRPQLKKHNYNCVVLEDEFWKMPIPQGDVFYTSKMLEHLSLDEVFKTLDHTSDIRYHVHVIDYGHYDDTHVLELDSRDAILTWYDEHGYAVSRFDIYNDGVFRQLRIFAGKRYYEV